MNIISHKQDKVWYNKQKKKNHHQQVQIWRMQTRLSPTIIYKACVKKIWPGEGKRGLWCCWKREKINVAMLASSGGGSRG